MTEHRLLSAEDIEALEGVSAPHPVSTKVKRITKSLGDPAGLTGIGVHLFETAPGADTTAFHFHHFEDEAVYVLSGTGEAKIGDQTYQIGPGDFMGHPKGGPAHIIRNTGSAPLRCLIVGERLDADVIDYPDAGKRLIRSAGKPDVYEDLNGD